MRDLNEFPRVRLGVLPTRIRRMEQISRTLGVNVYIKRDDLTGIGLGGNKVRKLEFLLADARAKGAKVVFTTGGAQSNHAMLTAACANKLGMKPILLLKKRGVTACKGNRFLESLMDTEVHYIDTDDYGEIYAEMDRMGQALGLPYYKIPCGGSNALGCLGYYACAEEISQVGITFDHIICATGSGGTHAGLALGAKLLLPRSKVTGMAVDSDPFDEIVPRLMRQTAELLESDIPITSEDVHLRNMCGPGYAIPSEEGNAAVRLVAQKEGIFLDPVYTGKAFAGLIEMVKEGTFASGEKVLFVHTGGAGGLFALEA